jgi:hypothetical protein
MILDHKVGRGGGVVHAELQRESAFDMQIGQSEGMMREFCEL